MSWHPKAAKELIELTAQAALSKDPIDKDVEVFVDPALNKCLDDYEIVASDEPLTDNVVEMVPNGLVFKPLVQQNVIQEDDDTEKLSEEAIHDIECVYKAAASIKRQEKEAQGLDTSKVTAFTDAIPDLDDIDAVMKHGGVSAYETVVAQLEVEDKKWSERMQKYGNQLIQMKLNVNDDDTNFLSVLDELTEYGLKTIPKQIADAIEDDVVQVLDGVLDAIPLKISKKDNATFRNEFLTLVRNRVHEVRQAKEIQRQKTTTCSVEIQTDPYARNFHLPRVHFFNYVNTESCKSPYYPDEMERLCQPVDPELLCRKLQATINNNKRDEVDSRKALDPDVGLLLEEGYHTKIISVIHARGHEHREKFEEIQLDPSKDLVVQTLFYRGIWYKLVLEKVVAEENGEVHTRQWFVGIWKSSVVPKHRCASSIRYEGKATKRTNLPLTQEERDAINMPPPKLPYRKPVMKEKSVY